MKVTDVQYSKMHLAVHERGSRARVSLYCFPLWEFFFFALIKLDFPVDENVHLNVNTHISRPRVKYGGLGDWGGGIIYMSAFIL